MKDKIAGAEDSADKGVDAKEESEHGDDDDDDEDSKKAKVGDGDIFTVKDVCDIGGGEPLFVNFGFEDWALSSLRFELDALVKFWKKDVNDPDRPAIPEQHFSFYYGKYFKKQLNTRFFGMNSISELFSLVRDTVQIENDIV